MAMPLISQEQCRRICRDDQSLLPFYCKSFHYQRETQLCLLSENDGSDHTMVNSTRFTYYEATCIGGDHRGKEAKSSSATSPLSQSFGGETGTAELRLLRNSLLEAEPYVVYQGYLLGRCLDECLFAHS